MELLLRFNDIKVSDKTGELIIEWLRDIIKDKSVENLSPLRYADALEIIDDAH